MASGSGTNLVKLKGTFKGLSRSASRTGLVTTAKNRRNMRNYQAKQNQSSNRF